jgi:hypothetical protein
MASCDASVLPIDLPLDLLLDLLLDNAGFRLLDLRLELHAGCCGQSLSPRCRAQLGATIRRYPVKQESGDEPEREHSEGRARCTRARP